MSAKLIDLEPLTVKRESPKEAKLGEILLRQKLISQQDLTSALKAQSKGQGKRGKRAKKRRIGDILLQLKLIRPEDLQRALLEQNWRKKGFWVI